MKNIFKLALSLSLLTSSYCLALGESITVSGSPAAMTINSAVAGQQPAAVTNTSTTYSVFTLLSITRVTARINSNMPANVTLQISLAAPPGATSLGLVTMNTTAKNMVTNIGTNILSGSYTITYRLSATVTAAKTTNATRTVTYTIQ